MLWCVPKLITFAPIVPLYQSSEIPDTPGSVIRDPSYSEGRLEWACRFWYSLEIDASKFILHILSDTPGVFQRLKYVLVMAATTRRVHTKAMNSLNGYHMVLSVYSHDVCILYGMMVKGGIVEQSRRNHRVLEVPEEYGTIYSRVMVPWSHSCSSPQELWHNFH